MIIVAGGSGSRMGADIPKQFIELNGKPILMHTLQNLHEMDNSMELILVLPEKEMDAWEQLCHQHQWQVPHKLANGGKTRFLSVKSGLALVDDGGLVGVHDGVRPFVSAEVINACFRKAEESGAAVPVIPIVQSLRKVEEDCNRAVDRNKYRAVQTPQCFRADILKKAFETANEINISDDASVVESAGYTVSLVEGNVENIKITTKIDLKLAKLLAN